MKAFYLIIVLIFHLIPFGFASAEEQPKTQAALGEIKVTEEKIIAPTKETTETVYTGVEVTKKGIELGGEPARSHVWKALSILPGVLFDSYDPANLSSTQFGIRVRGVSGGLGTMSVEGIPIYGGNPIGPRTYILDLENFTSLGFYKGVVPVELGSGTGTRGGTIELKPLWAKESFSIDLKQSLGMFEYKKSFVRIDSGKLNTYGTRFSFSYSFTEEEKWRGKGTLGPRDNLNFTFVQPIGDSLNLRVWFNYNNIPHHKYRSLSYAQASDLKNFRRYDYTTEFTGNPSVDWQFYEYNTLEWENKDLFAYLDYKFSDLISFQLKPYYREEEKNELSGSSSLSGPTGSKPGVSEAGWTTKRYGLISQIFLKQNNFQGLLGYHYQASEWLDSKQENYWLNPNGSLTFVGWGRFTESKDKSPLYSPFLRLSGNMDMFNWQVGIKHLKTKDTQNEGYLTKYTATNVPYLAREPLLDYGGREYTAWLPSLGLSYTLGPTLEIYTSAGRTFQTPYAYMPLVNLYYNLYPKFKKMGITLDDLFKDYKPEITNNIDLGIRFRTDRFELYPTIYYSKHKNLNTPITPGWKDPDDPTKLLLDPTTKRPVSFNTFVGEATGYGLELGSNLALAENLHLFFNPSYVKMEYDEDIVSRGITYNVTGKQVVNVPKKMLSAGLIAKWYGFEIIPKLRYIGKSYGDLNYTEKIPGYTVADLGLSYTLDSIEKIQIKNLKFTLEVYNVLDKEYFVPNYYPGVPFTVFGSIYFNF